MTESPPLPIRSIYYRQLAHSSFGNNLVLILSAEVGVLLGAIFLLIGGAGLMVVPWFLVSFWAVPLFGFIGGSIGLSRARDSVIRSTRTTVLPDSDPLSQRVATLAGAFGLPLPRVGIYAAPELNAFAAGSGPANAVVSFSRALVDQLPPVELDAIIGHELAHIANNDMRRLQFATSFQNTLTWYLAMTDRGQSLMRMLLGTLAELMVLGLSRSREYWADATSAAVVGKEAMIAALRRLDGDPVKPTAERLAYARLMIRSHPREWFSTHPTIAKRIAALEAETYLRRLPIGSA